MSNNFIDKFEYLKLSPQEQELRGILGRLVGKISSWKNPTRNGRTYGKDLWERVFKDPIFQEKINNKCLFGEISHPLDDRQEIDPEKIAICLAETPTIADDGFVYGVFDILNSKCGQILKTLLDYGTNIAVSSRGRGDIIQDYDGNESVDPTSYDLTGWDAVFVPSVKEAHPIYVTESLNNRKSLTESLNELVENADEKDKAVMKEVIDGIEEQLNGKGRSFEDRDGDFKVAKSDNTLAKSEDTGEVLKFPSSKEADEYIKEDNENLIYSINYFGEDGYNNKLVKANSKEEAKGKFKMNNPDKKVISVKEQAIESFEEDLADKVIDAHDEDEVLWNLHNTDYTDFYNELNSYLQPGESTDARDADGWPLESNLDLKDLFRRMPKEKQVDFANRFFKPYTDRGDKIDLEDSQQQLNADDIDEAVESTEADNNRADIVDELQETLNSNKKLENLIIDLQEKLSVCYAKEAQYEEKISKLNEAVNNLTKNASKVKPLELKITSLTELLSDTTTLLKNHQSKMKTLHENSKELVKSKYDLSEDLNNKNQKIEELNNSVAELNESITKLKQDSNQKKIQYSEKLAKANNLVEQYKKVANKAINRYIDFQATRIGCTSNEIKNRLPESYGFDDIDTICEGLENYQLEVANLPFSGIDLNNTKLSIKKPIKESIIKNPEDDWDVIDDSLIRMAERFG